MAKRTQTWSRAKLLRFSAITVVLALVIAEGVARLLFAIQYHGLGTSVFIQGSPLQVKDTGSVYNNRACYVDYNKDWQYNELGMKSACGDYRMPAKKGNELWVLLLGGSAMEGMGSNKEGAWLDITGIADHPFTETIACCLQNGLQWKFPGRRVRVFNAAVSGFTLEQVMAKYRELSQRFDFDWVVSMDGVNECDTLDAGTADAESAFSQAYWASFPFHRWPLKAIVPVTQHSAFFNWLKQEVYHIRMNARLGRDRAKGYPLRGYWADRVTPPLRITQDKRVGRSVQAFLAEERDFAGQLERAGKRYLLLVQPYLAFRDTAIMTREEIALDHYLRTVMNDGYKAGLLRMVSDSLRIAGAGQETGGLHIQDMSGVLKWPGWIFVDYCHFTRAANERIAEQIMQYIAADGNVRVFR